MNIYLVGGAVRDRLLGLPVTEKDWVVVGSSPEEMIRLNYKPVGNDFPVFLHPETREEYALARTEKKESVGYQGFSFYCQPDVTLEDDLKRRDLTINAIAEDANGNIIDPYDGCRDIKNRIFRHVSTAFSEDPVRILRIARFATRFTDFSVCQETNELMKTMARNGEVDALVAERVWKELSRALSHSQPDRFFNTLNQCHALQSLFPQINEKSLINLQHAALFSCDPIIRFSSLCGNLSQKSLQSLISTYKIPKQFSDIALLHVRLGTQYKTLALSPQNILSFLKSIDAFRRPERLPVFCQSIELQKNSNLQTLLNTCIIQIKNISTDALQEKNLKGKEFANALEELQLDAINSILTDYPF